MKKEWQQKAQALSRADMKKIKGGNVYMHNGPAFINCAVSQSCTVAGKPGFCIGDDEGCGCMQLNCPPNGPCLFFLGGECIP